MPKLNRCCLLAFCLSAAPLCAQIGPEYMSHQPNTSDAPPIQATGRAPIHRCTLRTRWRDDQFLEQQFQDSAWPARRDDELSDQLSR